MEKKEKTSPFQDGKLFDPAGLLGASPFSPGLSALPFAHLAHLPGAFSMLGHPAFPVTSLFGRLGDGLTNPLGIPSSLASSLSPTSGPSLNFDSILSPLLLSGALSGSASDPSVSPSTSSTLADISAKYGLFSSSSASTSPLPKSSSSHATTASSTSPPPTSSRGRGRGRGGYGRGSRGGGGRGSRGGGGRGSRGGGRGSALLTGRGRPKKLIKQPPIPMSLVQSNSILSPSLLEKYSKKRETNGINGVDTEVMSEKSSVSSLFELTAEDKSTGKDQKLSLKSSKLESQSGHGRRKSPKLGNSSVQDKVHIDSLKKKLIADQIREKMQNKAETKPESLSSPPSPDSPGKKDQCRDSIQSDSEDVTKELEAERKKQERIKRELELELRQQQIALKLMQEAKSNKVKAADASNHNDESTQSIQDDADKNSEAVDGSDMEEDKEELTDKCDTPSSKDEEGDENIHDASQDSGANSNQSSSDDSSDSDDGSSSDSSSSSSSSDSESENSGVSENEGEEEDSSKSSSKRKLDLQNDNPRPVKRRHVVLDEEKIKVPLEKGWQRQTYIHSYGRRGIVGEVWYFAPCGRKMKTIPDIMRYIERNAVTELGRDYFSFNTKVNVGEFYEARSGTESGFEKLSDVEIQDRLSVTVNRRLKNIETQKRREKLRGEQGIARQMFEGRMKQRMEHQGESMEMARKVAEIQFQRRLEREQQRELLKRAKQMKLMEKKKQKDHIRLMREQERMQKEEQLRIKREIRAQQMMEKQQKRDAVKQKKHLKALRKAEEREIKRQQAAMLKEQIRMKQEQERRRQHMLLLKALEQRKKQEERERVRQEKFAEKRLFKARKNEQRRIEFALAQELKKPREDMELLDSKPMPEFERIPGNLLDGEPFANCLMTLEFLHNFSKVLGFDKDSLPTLKSLQDSVICKTEEDGEEYISLVMHLLQYALDDPGVPNPKEAVTKLGQKIVDIELTDGILSEILRIFMVIRNGGETELSEHLRSYPLEACSVTQRAEVLAFLCNELNSGRTINNEVENCLDRIADLRRDKWVIERKLRRLRVLRSKFKRQAVKGVEGEGEDSMMTSISKQSDEEDDKEDASGNEDEMEDVESQDDDPSNMEECIKQMEKFYKQQAQHREKMFDTAHHIRAIDLGQDRYKRNYWILPVAGGVYVESMESAETKDMCRYIKNDKLESKSVKIEVISEKTEKKGVQLLEEIEEKKAVEILKEDTKKKVGKELNTDIVKQEVKNVEETDTREIKCENGFLKTEKELLDIVPDSIKDNTESVIQNIKSEKSDKDNGSIDNKEDKHCENSSSKVVTDTEFTEEKERNREVDHDNQKEPQTSDSVSGNLETVKSPTKLVELKIPTIKSSAIENETTNLFLQVPTSTRLSEFCNISTDSGGIQNSALFSIPSSSVSTSNTSSTHHVTKSTNHSSFSPPGPKPPPAHSNKQTSDRKSSFMSIDSILEKKTGSSQNDNSFQASVLPVNPFTSPHSKGLSDSPTTDTKPWFSILPRVPCDDMSLTRSRGGLSSSMLLSPPFMSQLPFHPFPLQSPTFASFQMGQLYNCSLAMPISITNTPTTSATNSQDEESFKIPELPATSSTSGTDALEVLKTLQGEVKPIPEEFTKGWWRITDPDQISDLEKCLHPRGIREKNLSKMLQKFQDYTSVSCTKGKEHLISLECSDESDEEEEEMEVEDSEKSKVDGENDAKTIGEKKSLGEIMETDTVKTQSDSTVDSKTDKIQKDAEKGDKTDIQAESEKEKVNQEDEKEKVTSDDSKNDKKDELPNGKQSDEDKADESKKTAEEEEEKRKVETLKKKKKTVPVIDCKEKSDEADRLALEEVQTLEDKVANASLQIKGWKLAPKTYLDESDVNIIPRGTTKKSEDDVHPVECAKERLLQLESNIERRYLKPPLSRVHKINLSHRNSSNYDGSEDDAEPDFGHLPPGLQTWRVAVATATSPAQLMLCVMQLNNCISWEKSIMKVLCQICRKDDNEAELLLCDGCDRGYHTYCFKPKLETVPEGDWYCFECVSKTVGETCCLVCGRRLGRMAECHQCNRCVHIDCLDPPLPRIPRKWFCTSCEDKQKGPKKRQRKSSTASNTPVPATTPAPTTTPTPTPSTPAPAPTPTPPATPDLTPTGRKRRSDYGIPRKHKTSETVSDCDSPKKRKETSPIVNGKNVTDGNTEKTDGKSEKEKLKQCEESTDLAVCRTILTEMMKHEDGWPFLQPVNCKHFPSYRKYIKHPMDFGSMKIKLRDHIYTKRSEFVHDAYLVFDNCKVFNEDDSEVGKCGHNMRKYVTKRWKELLQDELNKT